MKYKDNISKNTLGQMSKLKTYMKNPKQFVYGT
jgi:hypothetical protein